MNKSTVAFGAPGSARRLASNAKDDIGTHEKRDLLHRIEHPNPTMKAFLANENPAS